MSNHPNTHARHKEWRERGMPHQSPQHTAENTMITEDSFRLLLTQASLVAISNKISAIVKRKMRTGEIAELTKFIAMLPAYNYYRMTVDKAQQTIANDFLTRFRVQLGLVQEQDIDERISGIDRDTDSGGIVDYEKKELLQFTPDENQYKFTAHAERRGNAIIDRAKMEGERSAPDNILPLNQVTQSSQAVVNRELYRGMKTIQHFLDPDSVESMFMRIQTGITNYFNINLSRQLLQFDSRNRVPTSSEYKWYLNRAGQPGQLGDVMIQDTLQQMIQMRLFPFWAPINASVLNPYAKIRVLIRELQAQSVTVTEFIDPSQSIPTLMYYHFELEVKQVVGDRMYLVPIQDLFNFRKPMAQIESVTFVFRTPFGPEVFDPDYGLFTITYGLPTLFTITNPTVTNLNTGDLIYVYNSNSGNQAIDTEINRPAGQVITKLNPTQFTIAVDSSILVGTETDIKVYFGSKRIFFEIEFNSLEQ